jgi:hypothetical protein
LLKTIIGLSLFCASALSAAQENQADTQASTLWLNYAEDEDAAQDYTLHLNAGINLDDSILLTLGQSESELLGEKIETNQLQLGYSTFRLFPWANTIFYEYWGKRKELVIESLGYDINYFALDWNAGVALEYRQIDFYTREFVSGQRRYEVDSVGVGVHTGVIQGDWHVSLDANWYDYSEDIQRLNTLRGVFILGLKNFDHASSLNSWAISTRLSYKFSRSRLGLGYAYAVAELDRLGTDSLAVFYDVELSTTLSVGFELGRRYEQQDLETDYFSLGLGFHF